MKKRSGRKATGTAGTLKSKTTVKSEVWEWGVDEYRSVLAVREAIHEYLRDHLGEHEHGLDVVRAPDGRLFRVVVAVQLEAVKV